MLTSRSQAILAAQMAANLLAVYVLWQWFVLPPFRLAALGVPICQALLIAIWTALGDGRWYWRLLAAFVLFGMIGYTIVLSGMGDAPRTGGSAFLLLFGLGLAMLQLATTVLLMPVRQLRGWRLTMLPQSNVEIAKTQFRLRDLLVWTSAVAITLAAGRGMMWIDEQNGVMAIFVVVVFALGILPIVLSGFFTALAKRNRARWLMVFAIWTLTYCSIWAAVNVWNMVRTFQVARPGWIAPWWFFWPEVATVTGLHVLVAVCTIGNMLVLRGLGMTFLRPQRGAEGLGVPPRKVAVEST